MAGKLMAYKDMFTVLVVDSRIERSQSLRDAFERILGHLRDDHHLRTDVFGTTRDAVTRLRNDASVACLLLEWDGKTGGIDGQRVVACDRGYRPRFRCSCECQAITLRPNSTGCWPMPCAA